MNWWTAIIVALIYTAPPAFLVWLTWKHGKAIDSIKIQGLESHKLMNSRLSELLAITRKSARAKGRLEGQAAERKKTSSKS